MHDASRGTLKENQPEWARADSGGVSDGRDDEPQVPALVMARLTGTRLPDRRAAVSYLPALHWYAVFLTVCILVLICSGGLVTSKGAGLAVPDWPTSYGYNMFAFPFSRWASGGVLYEHSHRLIASTIGFLTLILSGWLWAKEKRRWLCWLGVAAAVAVITQGVLGGLRVVKLADWIGIFHALLAQAFLALVAFIALALSRWWQRLVVPDDRRPPVEVVAGLGRKLVVVAVLIYLQLALGAAMRHAHAGLSIPDFPKAYGSWWPHVTRANLSEINRERTEVLHQPPTTVAQIHLQMMHRINAVLILGSVIAVALGAHRRRENLPGALRKLAGMGVALVALQITLGIYTIWTNKAADVATSHVAVGATLLVWSVLTYAALRRWTQVSSRIGQARGAGVRPLQSAEVAA